MKTLLFRLSVACTLALCCGFVYWNWAPKPSTTFAKEPLFPDVVPNYKAPAYLTDKKASQWADSVLNTLTLDQKIGQLFMVAAFSNKDKAHTDEITKLIKTHHIGGLIFMQGTAEKEVELTNLYQSISKVPLMLSIDGEWGLGMRLDNVEAFPKQMTLGAIQNDTLIYEMGLLVAKQCKRIGLHINFAPDIDVNNNPANPVINMRSFGEDKKNVTRKGIAYMKGLQDLHVLASAKHFPGHGDTDVDSHKDLPEILHDTNRLKEIELYPFQQLINAGVGSVMVAHLNVPALDKTKRPTTLSPIIIKQLLRQRMGFEGLIFTDALNMKGVAKYYQPGEVDLLAFKAGNDVLLFAGDVEKGVGLIKKAITTKDITIKDVEERCRKILKAKYWMGLHKKQVFKAKDATKEVNQATALMNHKLYKNAITLVKNHNTTVPLKQLEQKKIACIAFDSETKSVFEQTAENYAPITSFKSTEPNLKDKLKDKTTLVVVFHNPKNRISKNAVLSPEKVQELKQLHRPNQELIIVVLGNPYSLSYLEDFANNSSIIVGYEDTKYTQNYTAQVVFGGLVPKGKLPVSVGKNFKLGEGLVAEWNAPIRLHYSLPELEGYASSDFEAIDEIMNDAIKAGATPGGQVLVAQNGAVLYHKAFGTQNYTTQHPVRTTDLYDLASLTKIMGASLSMMHAYDAHKITLNSSLGELLPRLKTTNKNALTLKEIFTHEAGLPAWIPFFNTTLKDEATYKKFYTTTKTPQHSIPVTEKLFLLSSFKDSIYNTIDACELKEKKYVYSDLGYYYWKQIVETQEQIPYEDVLQKRFYAPLGLGRMMYNPLKHLSHSEICPTENDQTFRKQLIHGTVHDQGASMLGGVGGHAGLFANANSVAVIAQLLLNKGTYGGVQYLKPETVDLFTSYQSERSRRGICFDKPEKNPKDNKTVAESTSQSSYGHTGFTGTFFWVNPEKQTVVVVLTNRVYPDAENKKLAQMSTRTKIQEVVERITH